jgi:hypothetical protein
MQRCTTNDVLLQANVLRKATPLLQDIKSLRTGKPAVFGLLTSSACIQSARKTFQQPWHSLPRHDHGWLATWVRVWFEEVPAELPGCQAMRSVRY